MESKKIINSVLLFNILGMLMFFIMFLGITSCVSQTQIDPSQLVLQNVILAEKNKNELYELSMKWVAREFKSANEVIQYENKTEGQIIAKGFTTVKYTIIPVDLWFTLTIEVKDGKARITLDQLYNHIVVSGTTSEDPLTLQGQWDVAKPELQKIIDAYDESLQNENDQW